jgi:hypothetical protein
MSRNPVPILIPCHRVIAGDGTLGGYGGSTYADRQAALAIKRRLLALEGVRPGSELGPGIEPTPRLDSRPATAENSTTPRDEHPEDGEHVTSQTPE